MSSLAAADDGTVYALTYADDLMAIDKKGHRHWTYSAPGTSLSSPMIGPDGTIYVCASYRKTANSGLTALRPNGTIRWCFDVQCCASGGLAMGADSTIYVGGRNHSLWAVTGEGVEKWHFGTDGEIYSPPAVAPNGAIFFQESTATNRILCLNTNGLLNFAIPGNRLGGFGVACGEKETLYLTGGSNETLQAIGMDGSRRWICSTPFSAFAAAVLDDKGNLYFCGLDHTGVSHLVALTPERVQLWQVPLGSYHSLGSPVVGADGTVYVASADPKLTAVSSNGVVKWVFKPGRPYGELFRGWRQWPRTAKQLFLGNQNTLIAAPVLTRTGVLYVGFGQPYSTLYAFDVGFGPSPSGPWAMDGANAGRTRGALRTDASPSGR